MLIHNVLTKSTKNLVAVSSAFLVTCTLLLLMQQLIRSDEDGLNDPPEGHLLEFVRLIDDPEVMTDPEPPTPPSPPEKQPAPPKWMLAWEEGGGPVLDFVHEIPTPEVGVGTPGTEDAAPIMMFAPEYPARALARGIEGYVVLEYTVTAAGTVENPVVLQAVPRGFFERAAMNAVVRFKYRPRVLNGTAVSSSGVRNVIRFELDGDKS